MTTRLATTILALLGLLSVPIRGYAAYVWDIQQLTSDQLIKGSVDIHSGGVAWGASPSPGDDFAVYFWDGSTITNLSASTGHTGDFPSVYGSTVAWRGDDGVYYWDGSTPTRISADAAVPSLDNGQIAWINREVSPTGYSYELRLWDGASTQVVDSWTAPLLSGINSFVSLDNGQIAYEKGNKEVWFWDGTNTALINPNDAFAPSLSEGQVAFEQAAYVGFWDGVHDDYPVCDSCYLPSLYHGLVALVSWPDYQTSGSLLLWEEQSQAFSEVSVVTESGISGPAIYGSEPSIVFVHENEVYLARNVPAPTSLLLVAAGLGGLWRRRSRLSDRALIRCRGGI